MKTEDLKNVEDIVRDFPKSVLVTRYKITDEEVDDLHKRWVNSHQFRTGSPWLQEIHYFEQEFLNDKFKVKFESEIEALTGMLTEKGKSVTVINQ